MKRVLLAIILASFFITIPGIGLANEKDKTSPGRVLSLDQMVVTASRVKEEKRYVTANVTIIDEKEIRQSPAINLGDLLAEKGIGHIQKYPGSLISVGIRGFRTETHGNDLKSHVLILLNGRRAGTGNVAKILTKNIARIEIIRGPAAVQYGSAAMGGIVNVITKKGEGKPSIFLDGKLGSFDYREGTAGFYGAYKKLDFSGAFTRSTMDDYDTAEGDKYHNTGIDEENSVSLNFGFNFLSENSIRVIYSYFDATGVGSPGYFKENDLDDYTDKYNRSVDFIYNGAIKDGLLSWKARYFFGKDEDRWFDPTGSNPDFWDDGIPSIRKTDQEGAQAQISLNLNHFWLTTGFDWVSYDIDATWNPKETEYDNPAGFLLAKLKLLDDKLVLSGGFRYDYYDVKVDEPRGRDENDDNVSLSFGASYIIKDFIKLRFNYGEAFVMPAADQMAADYVVWGTHYLGNPDLSPESSRTYEGGIDIFYGPFESSFTYFYTDFDDKIESVSKPGWIQTWENIGSATIHGLEGKASCDIAKLFGWNFELKPYASFVYLPEYENHETDEDLKYVSDINASYGITLSGIYGLSANLNFSYTGRQKIDDWENVGPPTWTAPVIDKGGFTVADFTISKELLDTRKYGNVILRGEVQNLLDKNYSYVKGYPMPGRSIYVGLKYVY